MAVNEEIVGRIFSLRAEGKTQAQIGEAVGLSQPEVSTVLRSDAAIKPEYSRDPVHLVARDPAEMAAAQADLGSFFERKIVSVGAEVDELSGAIAEAVTNGWKTATLDGQHRRARARKLFYEKCLVATRAGYTIIPNIPIDVFAIRTSRAAPRRNEQRAESLYTPNVRISDELPQILAVGEGEYRSPDQLVRNVRGTFKNEKGEDVKFHTQWAASFDEIEFPVIAAVPYVMRATEEAMAMRVFDQIGISPQGSVPAADPLIIGQIQTSASRWKGKTVSFLIAWHLDLRTL